MGPDSVIFTSSGRIQLFSVTFIDRQQQTVTRQRCPYDQGRKRWCNAVSAPLLYMSYCADLDYDGDSECEREAPEDEQVDSFSGCHRVAHGKGRGIWQQPGRAAWR